MWFCLDGGSILDLFCFGDLISSSSFKCQWRGCWSYGQFGLGISRHSSRWKLSVVVIGGGLPFFFCLGNNRKMKELHEYMRTEWKENHIRSVNDWFLFGTFVNTSILSLSKSIILLYVNYNLIMFWYLLCFFFYLINVDLTYIYLPNFRASSYSNPKLKVTCTSFIRIQIE